MAEHPRSEFPMPISVHHRARAQAGVAIGPLLFAIFLLAILATAIAVGQRERAGANDGTKADHADAKALIEIGRTLNLGMKRVMASGVPLGSVVIDPAHTSNAVDLFSPSGGGLVAPSPSLSLNRTDPWIYTYANLGGPRHGGA
jgi:hypothetical protein